MVRSVEIYERILELVLGAVFVLGGGLIAKNSLESKNLVETALFGLLGVATGLFLCVCGLCGAPGGPGN